MNYKAISATLVEELIYRFRPKAVINLCASCPSFLIPFAEQRIPTDSVCHGEEHAAWLKSSVQKLVFQQFLKPGSVVFRPALKQRLIADAEEEADLGEPEGTPAAGGSGKHAKKAKAKAKRAAKGKAKAKSKGKKHACEEDGEDEDSSFRCFCQNQSFKSFSFVD